MLISKKIIITLTGLLLTTFCCAQSQELKKIDSLKQLLLSLHDSSEIDCLLKISFDYGHVNSDYNNLFNSIDIDSANRYAADALAKSKKYGYQRGIANAYENLGEMAFTKNLKEGEFFFKTAISIYNNLHDYENLNLSYLWLGYYMMHQGRFAESRKVFEKALPYYKKEKNEKKEARVYTLLSLNYWMEGYFEKSFEYCLQEITVLEKDNQYRNDPIYLTGRLCDLYLNAGDTATAIYYTRKCIDYTKDHNKNLAILMMGDVCFYQHNYDSALYYYKTADSANVSVGEAYLFKKDYDKALMCFNILLQVEKQKNNVFGVMQLLNDIAKAYFYKNKWQPSLNYARQLLQTATSVHARQYIREANWQMWSLYNQKNQTDSAYKYRLQFDNINDSIAQDEFARNVAVAQMKFNNEQKQSQIDLLQKGNKIVQQRLESASFQKKILLAAIFALTIIGFIIIRNFTLTRHNEKLENEKKQSELQSKAIDLEMQALRAQMNPHFIFNCLSSINRFILKDEAEAASGYLTKFSRLIRMVLSNSKRQFISLEDELETLSLYLEMEKLRFKNSFDYKITFINDVDTTNIFVPPLLFQPFAENAIWHGLMHKDGQGRLEVELSTEKKILSCTITDNGIGRAKAAAFKSKSVEKHKSMGLQMTSERLALLNEGDDERTFFDVEDIYDDEGIAAGTRVVLKIKYKNLTETIQ